MTKKSNNVQEGQLKWHQRGFASKHEYIGWLQFNDLVDECFGYDDTYQDPYSGRTVRIDGYEEQEVENESSFIILDK